MKPGLSRLAKVAVLVSVATVLWQGNDLVSYFNLPSGAGLHGDDHLLDSNIDWGQDLYGLSKWYDAQETSTPLYHSVDRPILPEILGVPGSEVGAEAFYGDVPVPPGYYAISVNILRGYPTPSSTSRFFRDQTCIANVGNSIRIFLVSSPEKIGE